MTKDDNNISESKELVENERLDLSLSLKITYDAEGKLPISETVPLETVSKQPIVESESESEKPTAPKPSGFEYKIYKRTQGIFSDTEFRDVYESVKEAIKLGIQPIRIRQGSSGSYFVRNKYGQIVGVFKPKNEEPYGHLNPKWTKWLHKTCFPCFFGRGCLIPNLGYISESAASLLDRIVGLDIVPRTEVVELASSAFYYSWMDRKKEILPYKIGSLQIFLSGYRDATLLIRDLLDPSMLESSQHQFQLSFERLIILDYLMRNTDRGMDNWMVFFGTPEENIAKHKTNGFNSISSSAAAAVPQDISIIQSSPAFSNASWHDNPSPIIRVAGIDNGLAFPYKHPDEWRSYPFGWSWLPVVKIPFSEETISEFYPKLSDNKFIDELILDLKKIFMIDPDFDDKLFKKQMELFRGQLHNLLEAFEKKLSPYELIRLPLLMIMEDEESNAKMENNGADQPIVSPPNAIHPGDFIHKDTTANQKPTFIKKKWKKMMVHVKPCFTWC